MSMAAECRLKIFLQTEALLVLLSLLVVGCGLEQSQPAEMPKSHHDSLGHSFDTTDAEQIDFEKREAVMAEKTATFFKYFHETQELGPKIPEMNDDEKRRFDELHRLQGISLTEELKHLRPLDERTLGYLHVGRHGELLYATPASAPGRIRIIRTDEGLELMTIDTSEYRWFYGKVRANGKCVIANRYRSGTDVARTPYNWAWTDEHGAFVAPGPDSPIATSDQARPLRPSGAVGWLFPTRYNEFVCVSPEVEPIADCLWVVENGQSLDIVHSGPSQSGLYARVHENGRIQFGTPMLGSGNRDWSDATWKILNRKDNPEFDAAALARNQFVLPERLEITYEVRTDDGAIISFGAMPFPHCI